MKMHRLHHLHRRPDRSPGSSAAPQRRLLSVLLIAPLMVILDISAVNVALPDLARDLQIGASEIGWTIHQRLAALRQPTPARRAHRRPARSSARLLRRLSVFTAASLASALGVSSTALFAARAGQGLGPAMLSPASLSIITTSFRGTQRARALGAWGAVAGAGVAVGVLLGGVLTQVADSRAIFFINLPVAAGVALIGRNVVPADPRAPLGGTVHCSWDVRQDV